MEVTTVSPPPISPTNGSGLCERDVSSVAIHSVTLLLGVCGLVGNGALLSVIDLSLRSTGILDLAIADFLFLLLMVPSSLLFLLEDVSCSPILPLVYVSFLFQLSVVSYAWALFRLTGISRVMDMEFLCRHFCHCKLPQRLSWAVESVQYWAFFALFTVLPSVTFLCPSHQQEHCRAALISIFAVILLLFVAPLLISYTIDFIKAKCGSQQQQPTKHHIVVFLLMLFIVLLSLWNFLQQLGYIVVSSQVVLLLTCIHSSIKPFICFLVWRPCFMGYLQLSMQRVFEEQKDKTSRRKTTTRDTGV